ncbi:DUF1761 domain-containing protein [Vibrio hepatarius]|uniref:DUF1761 domain-containing protein n=1 Tax=Vibrio hepatarius TaxID=171383 RepID=UPI00142DA53C|nr:DUF1761 domain-containing protein [Vibrio hepatarius]NIY84502.1 DUF1761 domain-containing protein [Vibrio hepatarius]
MKKLLLATLSYFVLTMALAYPWHLIWFHDIYKEIGAVQREEPIMILGISSIIIQGLVIAYLYPFYYKSGNPVFHGIKFSLLIGLMVYTVVVFANAAKFLIEPVSTFLLYGTAFSLLQFSVTGTALGLIYGRKNSLMKKESSCQM